MPQEFDATLDPDGKVTVPEAILYTAPTIVILPSVSVFASRGLPVRICAMTAFTLAAIAASRSGARDAGADVVDDRLDVASSHAHGRKTAPIAVPRPPTPRRGGWR